MSLTQFLRILWARRMVVLVCTLSALVAAFIVSQMLPERYQAQSRLLLDVVKPDPVTGEVITSPFAKAYSRTQIELVRDRRVAGFAAESLKLEGDPEIQEAFAESGGGGNFQRWLVGWIIARTQARLVDGSNVLEISFTAPTPQLASRVANALRDGFVSASLAFRREGAAKTADWYAQQTQKARLGLLQAEKAKTDFERRTGLILEGASDVDSVRLAALAGTAPQAGGVAGPAAQVSSTPSGAQLAQVDAAIAQSSQSLGPNHPEMQELQRKRAALAGLAAQERASANAAASASANAAVRSANAGASAVTQAYQTQRSRVIGQRAELEQLRRLQTEVEVRREQYSRTAARAGELRQQAEVSDAGLTLLGSAETPGAPVSPNRPLILAGALGFGFAFGILLALLLELLNRRVRGVEDMVGMGEVPLLAVISSPADRRAETPLLGWSGRT
jgi:uncharacterized protein involved in exopolysaccharide biosynthesis